VSAVEASGFDNARRNLAHVESNTAWGRLIDLNAAELFRDALSGETRGAVGPEEVELKSRDVVFVESMRPLEILFVGDTDAGVVSGEDHGDAAARSGPRFGACRFLLLAGYELRESGSS
jgi:hypothetical protein